MDEKIISAPIIRQPRTGGMAQIYGFNNMSQQQVEDIAKGIIKYRDTKKKK